MSAAVDLFRYRTLLWNLVLKDLRLKYRNSMLGLAWSLLHPLLMLVVYSFAFRIVLRVQAEHYPYFLLAGLLPWTFFAGSLLAGTKAVIANARLVSKVYFPREVLPLATVLFWFAQLLLALIVFLPALALFSGVPLRWGSMYLLPLLVLHFMFTAGLTAILAATTVFLRDVEHLTEVALPLLFWITPIVYPASMAPPVIQVLFRLSPLAAFATAYQDVLLRGRAPDGLTMATLCAWTMACLVCGYLVYKRLSPMFAEEA